MFYLFFVGLLILPSFVFSVCDLRLLTNQNIDLTFPPKPPFLGSQFSDPASPRLEKDGSVKIYGTGNAVLVYSPTSNKSAMEQLLHARNAEIQLEHLAHPDGTLINEHGLDEAPWDLSVETFNNEEFLYAGVMSRAKGNLHAHFPEDNWNRRVYAFKKKNNIWIREQEPLTYEKTQSLTGHSYGHHFIQDEKNQTWIFYERVLEKKSSTEPTVTGLFARQMITPLKSSHVEHEILNPSNKSYPAQRRGNGDLLVEGARPFRLSVSGKTIYVILFSSGDFATDHYGINLAWSRKLLGPYKVVTNSEGSDLKDFGKDLRSRFQLGWGPARGTLFHANGSWHLLFAAVRKNLWPRFDFDKWPDNFETMPVFRDLFLTEVSFLMKNGDLQMVSACDNKLN